MKQFPKNLVAFSWMLVGKMVLYTSKLILLLSSYMKSSVKMSGPVPETIMHAQPWQHLHHALQMRPYAWDLFQFPFFSTLLLSHHLDKGSSLSHLSINTVPKTLLAHLCAFLQTLILPFYFCCWSKVCIFLCSICNSVSKSPEDSGLSEHHPSFLEALQTRLLGFIFTSFRVHFHSFYDLSVINYCCFLSRFLCCWWFPLASKLLAFLLKSLSFVFTVPIHLEGTVYIYLYIYIVIFILYLYQLTIKLFRWFDILIN